MYRYETHLHTNLVSACSCFTPEQIVEKYTALGYAGVAVTDHFLNGNTTVPADLSWKERISRFCEGYRAVKKRAGKLAVLFGFEYSYKGTDFLVYGLEEEWLLANERLMDMTAKEFCLFARAAGGLVVQAHPTREASYIDHVRLFPSDVDGFETLNACRTPRENRLADIYAGEYGLIKTAGSDIHSAAQNVLAGMEFDKKPANGKEFAQSILKGEGRIFTLPQGESL